MCVSSHPRDRILHAEGLKQQTFTSSQFWRLGNTSSRLFQGLVSGEDPLSGFQMAAFVFPPMTEGEKVSSLTWALIPSQGPGTLMTSSNYLFKTPSADALTVEVRASTQDLVGGHIQSVTVCVVHQCMAGALNIAGDQ